MLFSHSLPLSLGVCVVNPFVVPIPAHGQYGSHLQQKKKQKQKGRDMRSYKPGGVATEYEGKEQQVLLLLKIERIFLVRRGWTDTIIKH